MITKKADAVPGKILAGELGSHQSYKGSTRYGDPADVINVQNEIRQGGRTFRIKLDYGF